MNRLAALAALLFTPALAFAWGGQGHQVVALIAQIHLTPEAKAEITKLLGPGVNIYDADVASWADQIKRAQRSTADWHYVNIPFDADGYDEDRDGHTKAGKPRDNLIHAIHDQVAILSDTTAPKEKRAEALKWVVHLIGDSTQPLHCAVRGKDGGGNGCKVWMPGSNAKTPSNLHTVWDTSMLTKWIGRMSITDYAQAIDSETKPADGKAMAAGTPEEWATESHELAVSVAYKGVPADAETHLTQSYVDTSKPVVEKQLERGGVRLAMVLNKAFGGATTRPTR